MALSLFSKSTSELIANYSRDGVSLEEQLATLSVLQAHTKDKTAEEFVKKHSQNIFHRKLRGIFELELEEEIIASKKNSNYSFSKSNSLLQIKK